MTLTNFFMQLKDDLERSGVFIDRIIESTNSVHLTFKSPGITEDKVKHFVSSMKRLTTKYDFNDVIISTKIDNGRG